MSELISTPKRNLRARTQALIIEGLKLFGIAIACLIALGVIVVVSARTGIVIPARWFGLILWTGFLTWAILRQYGSEVRDNRFWSIFLFLLVIHTAVFARVLWRYPDWRMAWFPLIVMAEVPCMAIVLGPTTRHKKHRR
jgi:hypothetical protein